MTGVLVRCVPASYRDLVAVLLDMGFENRVLKSADPVQS